MCLQNCSINTIIIHNTISVKKICAQTDNSFSGSLGVSRSTFCHDDSLRYTRWKQGQRGGLVLSRGMLLLMLFVWIYVDEAVHSLEDPWKVYFIFTQKSHSDGFPFCASCWDGNVQFHDLVSSERIPACGAVGRISPSFQTMSSENSNPLFADSSSQRET